MRKSMEMAEIDIFIKNNRISQILYLENKRSQEFCRLIILTGMGMFLSVVGILDLR